MCVGLLGYGERDAVSIKTKGSSIDPDDCTNINAGFYLKDQTRKVWSFYPSCDITECRDQELGPRSSFTPTVLRLFLLHPIIQHCYLIAKRRVDKADAFPLILSRR